MIKTAIATNQKVLMNRTIITNRRAFLAGALATSVMVAARGVRAQEAAKYRACVIASTGRGDYGHSMHLVFKHRADVALAAIADPDEPARVKAAAEAGAAKTYSDYRAMLAAEKPQLVCIAPRWTVDHLEMVRACVEAGAHIYMEKPVATSLAEADAMIAALDGARLKAAVAHQMRLSPVIQTLKQRIGEGLIGEILEMRGRGKEDSRAGGEDLIVLGVHVMDLMRLFAGADPASCTARITHEGRAITVADARAAGEQIGPVAGDTVQAQYYFPASEAVTGGVTGFFASQKNKDGAGGRFGLDVYGTRGVASIRLGLGPEMGVQVLINPKWRAEKSDAGWTGWKPLEGFDDPNDARRGAEYLNALAVDDLIAAIEEDRAPTVSIHDAHAALEMVHAAWEAALAGDEVALPLARREHPLVP